MLSSLDTGSGARGEAAQNWRLQNIVGIKSHLVPEILGSSLLSNGRDVFFLYSNPHRFNAPAFSAKFFFSPCLSPRANRRNSIDNFLRDWEA